MSDGISHRFEEVAKRTGPARTGVQAERSDRKAKKDSFFHGVQRLA
jgi:hypothetical protein